MRRACLLDRRLAGSLLAPPVADEPAKKYQVVTPKDDGIIATGINNRGAIVGFEWIESKEQPGVVDQVPFYAEGKAMTYLPAPRGLHGDLPGRGQRRRPGGGPREQARATRGACPAAQPGVRLGGRDRHPRARRARGRRGLVRLWDHSRRAPDQRLLGGQQPRAGLHLGSGRGGLERECLAAGLPRSASNTVVISDNGRYVAAADGGIPCLWSEDASGEWTREVIGTAASLLPRAVNNAGTVAGLRYIPDGFAHAVVWTREAGIQALAEPAGYVRSEASAVNNAGVVVGMIDGPGGSKIGPNAFVYEAGRLRLLDEAGPDFTIATAINDQGQVAGVLEKEEEPPAPENPTSRGSK